MNRYPLWKYVVLAIALLIGLLYTLPNFFGEAPAVQVASAKATLTVEADMVGRVEQILTQAGVKADMVQFDAGSVKARFSDTDAQLKARDALTKALNPDPKDASYVIALNLLPRTPSWMAQLHALPMARGLDLRGGVHFLLQVDMKAALTKKAETLASDLRVLLHDKNIRHTGINREGNAVEVRFRDAEMLQRAQNLLADQFTDLQWTPSGEGSDLKLTGTLKPTAIRAVQDAAIKQNITTLHNRINELGTNEPVIQQQGADRIVVELPGVQDPARAKDVIGRTATLEVRMVVAHDGFDPAGQVRDYDPAKIEEAQRGILPPRTELLKSTRGRHPDQLIVSKDIVFSGDDLTDAQPRQDSQNQGWVVSVSLNSRGAAAMKTTTRDAVKRRMAVIMIEKGKQEVLTAPTIQSELSGQFQISGMANSREANDLALLMRAGSLAAPMEFIEERTIGPSLGADNIAKGFDSVMYGFAAIAAFMCAYYLLFGLFSTLALGFNLLLLVAVLSMLQATLTLPGIAAIALTLGMAIDANVLINERVREELRNGSSPQSAISAGYERAFATILDSNITTLIAGLALLAFGSGPVRGFAVVHCLGILTSMFSAVMFSRGLVNLWYGRQKKLKSVLIGQVWKPAGEPAAKA